MDVTLACSTLKGNCFCYFIAVGEVFCQKCNKKSSHPNCSLCNVHYSQKESFTHLFDGRLNNFIMTSSKQQKGLIEVRIIFVHYLQDLNLLGQCLLKSPTENHSYKMLEDNSNDNNNNNNSNIFPKHRIFSRIFHYLSLTQI